MLSVNSLDRAFGLEAMGQLSEVEKGLSPKMPQEELEKRLKALTWSRREGVTTPSKPKMFKSKPRGTFSFPVPSC